MPKTETQRSALQAQWACIKRAERRRLMVWLAAAAALFLLCCGIRHNAYLYPDKFWFAQYARAWLLRLRLIVSRLAGTELWQEREAAAAALGDMAFGGSLARLQICAMSFASGAALALAGAVFQAVYRNPMASPNIIGATAGVRLGNVLVVMIYSSVALNHIYLRYAWCYGLTAVCVLTVLLLGRLGSGRRENYSIAEMIMAGSIVSQMLNVVTMYIMYNLEDEDLLIYEEISMGTYMNTDAASLGIFFGVTALTVLPVLALRYRMNAAGMDRFEAAALGIRSGPLRTAVQICGVGMVTCAMIHCGEIGMISMVIPYAVRARISSDLRHVCVYSCLAGGMLVLVCRTASGMFSIAGEPLPAAFFVSLITMPVFAVILAKQKGQRDEA